MVKRILVVDPYYGGSHRQWATGLKKFSRFDISIIGLPARHWKWRMHGGAITLADQFRVLDPLPDLILATDMLDVAAFLGLIRQKSDKLIPVITYFHENQSAYPKSALDTDYDHRREDHYAFINYTSALASDKLVFNSQYNKESFLSSLEKLLSRLPDCTDMNTLDVIRKKSRVIYPGIDTDIFDRQIHQPTSGMPPLVIWNHRWEYDKNPQLFFMTLEALKTEKIPFRLAVLGEGKINSPEEFRTAADTFRDRITHIGFVEDPNDYAKHLLSGDILPVTSYQDFFGISIMEAMYCGCVPMLPNRVSYPELIPDTFHETLFYQNDAEFKIKLSRLLTHPRKFARSEMHQIATRYSWKSLIGGCDELFQSMIEGNPKP